jgi:HPt (histidine-containing phosphotransfer) domain-containing protein
MSKLQWNKEFALEQTAGDEELLEELLVLFKDSSAADLAQLKEAVQQENMEDVAAAAHSLKGAAASLGIEGIRLLAMELEQGARENKLSKADEKVVEMEHLLDLLKKA